MALASLSAQTVLLFSCFITLIFSYSITTAAAHDIAVTKSKHSVAKLIHRDSIYSPYFNPNDTISDRAKRAIKNSITRYRYLKSKTKSTTFATDDYRASVIPEDIGAAFLAKISIGQPSVTQFLVIDTGSNLLWLQCLPCQECFEQKFPIFDPSKSSTYVNLSCDSPYCNVSPKDKCDQYNRCKYSQGYADGTITIGILATEMLTLETSDGGIVTIPDVIIGCGHKNTVNNGLTSGVLGLGSKKTSLVSQLGNKFSHCVGNIGDIYYNYNQLIFGDAAKIEGSSTPIELYRGMYYVTLEGISIGEKKLNVEPATFERRPWGGGGAIIDSGTTYSWLVKSGFEPLSAEVQSLVQGSLLEQVINPYSIPGQLCYKGVLSRDLKGFPIVTFHFAGGADLVLDINSLFHEVSPNQFCMAVVESRYEDFTIIGMLAQQYYNVGYDLIAKTVSFQRIDCELLED